MKRSQGKVKRVVKSALVILLLLASCVPGPEDSGASLIRMAGGSFPPASLPAAHADIFQAIGQAAWEAPPASFGVRELTEEEALLITGSSWTLASPVGLEELAMVTVGYWDFDGTERQGQLIVAKELGSEVMDIFQELYEAGFPMGNIRLIEEFDAEDTRSMEANNTYAFCTRNIAGTRRYSLHSYGVAVDINPVQNPYLVGGEVYPSSGNDYLNRQDVRPGMITPGDACYNAFTSRGWSWGGYWASPDYQHFEKLLPID